MFLFSKILLFLTETNYFVGRHRLNQFVIRISKNIIIITTNPFLRMYVSLQKPFQCDKDQVSRDFEVE